MATETTLTSAKAWAPDLTSVAPEDAVPDALILATSTVAGTVEGDAPAVRVQYVDDASAGFVTEGTDISEADPDLAEVVVHTGKVSQLIKLSREQWTQPNASELLAASVRRAVTRAANIAYIEQPDPRGEVQTVTLTGSPSGGTFTLSYGSATSSAIAYNATAGTVQTAVQALDAALATATVTGSAGGPYTISASVGVQKLAADGSTLTGGTTPTVEVTLAGTASTPPAGLLHVPNILNGGPVTTDLDALIDLQADIAGNDGNPTHLVLSPTAWAELRKIKEGTTSARSLLGAGTSDTVPSLLNLPVLVSNAVPAHTGLMIDRTAVVAAVGNVLVAQSEHAYFKADSIAVRCTWRFGANLVHPNRAGKFTTSA